MTPSKAATSPPAVTKRRGPKGARSIREIGKKASAEAKKVAAVVLEVLGGTRTPPQAAEALGCSLPRYYVLEARALDALLEGCEPRGAGRQRTPERELVEARRRCARLERECARTQALVRATHRLVGVVPPPATSVKPGGGKRRPKRPTSRALVAAKVVTQSASSDGPATPGTPAS